MNHLNNWFHHWHSASGSRDDYLLPSGNCVPLEGMNWLYWQISKAVAHRDLGNGSLAVGQGPVQILSECWWGQIKVPLLCNHCLDDQLRSASFDLQQLQLSMLSSIDTSTAYDKWEWMIDLEFIMSSWHSSPSLEPPFTIVCWPGKLANLGLH